MRQFGELLVEFTNRAGISDAELARSIGVQRQTIFRWKEGLVARPRYREDVTRIADKLRLTPLERDELLMAGGFPPDNPESVRALGAAGYAVAAYGTLANPSPDGILAGPNGVSLDEQPGARVAEGPGTGEPPASADAIVAEPTMPPATKPERLFPQPGILIGVATLLMLIVAVGGYFLLPRLLTLPTPEPTRAVVTIEPLPSTPTIAAPVNAPPIVVQPGQKLLLVAPFVGYTSEEMRFNVAGRIEEALKTEIEDLHLDDVVVATLPNAVTAQEQARKLVADSKASALIWGEYDAGRVRANVTVPGEAETNWTNPVDSPAKLAVMINDVVPTAARMLALISLGRIYRQEGELPTALHTFEKALSLRPEEPSTLAALNFYIGTLLPRVEGITPETLTRAVDHFTQALTYEPGWENLLYNRGTLYLGRALLSEDEQPDLDAAITDLTAVLAQQPTRIDPLLNRGIAYYERRGPEDLESAMADFTKAIELAPEDYRAYYHRSLAEIRAGSAWIDDMLAANRLQPNEPSILNGLCWGYGLAGEAAKAAPYCDAAVASDSSGSSLDSRAITYAQLGRYQEATDDLKAYLGWVRATYPNLYAKYRGPQVEQWLATLAQNANPFTPEVLVTLR